MNASAVPLQHSLEDLLGDLQQARRTGDVSRLAWLAYCELRRWARQAGETSLAERSTGLLTQSPLASREAFMAEVDRLIADLEKVHKRVLREQSLLHRPACLPRVTEEQ